MAKTYEATDIKEVEAIIMQIIMEKVEELVGDKNVKIIINGEIYDERSIE